MGGPGSGNYWQPGARSTTDEYRKLDIRLWARAGVLRPGYAGGWQWMRDGETVASIQMRAEDDRVIVMYRHRSGGDDWKDQQYALSIERTRCNLGGARPWFICPARDCGRRVAILYGGGIFACRRCFNLTYASTRESASDRASRRADKLRAKLGWDPGILSDAGTKPKWMRWRTYEQLVIEHNWYSDTSIAHFMESILKFK